MGKTTKTVSRKELFSVTLKYPGGKSTYTVQAADKMEAYEWGERQVEAIGQKAKIAVTDVPKD